MLCTIRVNGAYFHNTFGGIMSHQNNTVFVPSGGTYVVSFSPGSIAQWLELRWPSCQSGTWVAIGGSGVTGSNTSNGYVRLSNGLILQWGSVGAMVINNDYAIAFPISFPNAVFSVTCTTVGSERWSGITCNTFTISNSSFHMTAAYSDWLAPIGSKWMAIGY